MGLSLISNSQENVSGLYLFRAMNYNTFPANLPGNVQLKHGSHAVELSPALPAPRHCQMSSSPCRAFGVLFFHGHHGSPIAAGSGQRAALQATQHSVHRWFPQCPTARAGSRSPGATQLGRLYVNTTQHGSMLYSNLILTVLSSS